MLQIIKRIVIGTIIVILLIFGMIGCEVTLEYFEHGVLSLIFGGEKDTRLTSMCEYKDESTIIEQLKHESKYNIQRFMRDGDCAFTMVIKKGKINAVKAMIDKGIDLNRRNYRGETPLFYATRFNKLDIAKCLIENGAEVDIPNLEGISPLARCVWKIDDFLIMLIRNGANCNLTSPEKFSDEQAISILRHAGEVKDYAERLKWLNACLKAGKPVSNQIAKLYMSKAQSYIDVYGDKVKALDTLKEAASIAKDKGLQQEIKQYINKLSENSAPQAGENDGETIKPKQIQDKPNPPK